MALLLVAAGVDVAADAEPDELAARPALDLDGAEIALLPLEDVALRLVNGLRRKCRSTVGMPRRLLPATFWQVRVVCQPREPQAQDLLACDADAESAVLTGHRLFFFGLGCRLILSGRAIGRDRVRR